MQLSIPVARTNFLKFLISLNRKSLCLTIKSARKDENAFQQVLHLITNKIEVPTFTA